MCWASVSWKCSVFTQPFYFKFTYHPVPSLALLLSRINCCFFFFAISPTPLLIFYGPRLEKLIWKFCLFLCPSVSCCGLSSQISKMKACQSHWLVFDKTESLRAASLVIPNVSSCLQPCAEFDSYLAFADLNIQESKILPFATCSLTHSCTCLLLKWKQRIKRWPPASLCEAWLWAMNPLEVMDMHASHHVCRLDGPSLVWLCRLEIKPLVHLGHTLIVATVERYKIRALRGFFCPQVSQFY